MPFSTTFFAIDHSSGVQAIAVLETVDQFDEATRATSMGSFKLARGTWGGSVIDGIRATAFVYESPEVSWLVGDRGEVVGVKAGKVVSRHQLPDSGLEARHLGQPNDIRRIAGRLYVCGFAGQVYTQDSKGNWVHMDDGLAEKEGTPNSIDLESIDGTGPDNLYTVGSGGLVFHWNGKTWTRVPVLTNVYLARVRCFAPDNIVVVGEKGVVLESDGKKWNTSRIPGAEEASLSDVALFDGKLYVAAGDSLYVKAATGWQKVKHGLDPNKTQFIRMVVGDNRLWTMGFKRVNSFDGKKWEAHPDPNNG